MAYPTNTEDGVSSGTRPARIKKAFVIVGGSVTEISGTSAFMKADSRERFMMAVNEVNLKIEGGEEEVALRITFELSDGSCSTGTFEAKSILDASEFLEFDENDCHPEIFEWHRQMTEMQAVKANPDNSYVYLSVVDKDRGTIGRITARLEETDDVDEFNLALAFCSRTDTFSKNVGRMMVDEKMRRGEFMRVYKKSRHGSNFDLVFWLMDDIMHSGASDLVLENRCVNFPSWARPAPRRDIPKDVQEILYAVAHGSIGASEINRAKDILGMTGKHQTKFIDHRSKKTVNSEFDA